MWDLVAQLDRDSLAYVVDDDDDRRGLTASEFRPRTNSYDNKPHNDNRTVWEPEEDAKLRVWGIVLIRIDQIVVRLRPQWPTT